RPDRDVAEALAFLDARGQQIPGEGPLDGHIQPDVESDADGVGVLAGVDEASRQCHDLLLGKDQPYSKFGRYHAAVQRQTNLIRWVTERWALDSFLRTVCALSFRLRVSLRPEH